MTTPPSDDTGAQGPGSGRHDSPRQSPPGGPGPNGLDSFFGSLRRLDVRRTPDGWIGGVCAGLARRLGVDPIVVRAALVLLGLFFGLGVTLYLIAWLLIPDTQEQLHIEKALRHGDGTSILLLVVAALGLFGSGPWWGGDRFGGWWSFTGLALTALIAWLLWTAWQRRGPGTDQWYGPAQQPPAFYDASGQEFAAPPPGEQPYGPHAPGTQPSPYGPQPHAWSGSYPPAAPAAPTGPVVTVPRRPSRRAAGFTGAMLATGLALITYGSLLWAGAEYDWSGNHQSIAIAGALAALGAVLVVLGFAGRRSGFPGFLAGLVLIAALIAAPLPADLRLGGRIGDATWQPTAISQVEHYNLGIGDGTLDLTDLEAADVTVDRVDARVGIGTLRIRVPDDLTVRVLSHAGIGEITLADPDTISTKTSSGVNVAEDTTFGDGPADLTLDANVGIGQIIVQKD